jgi:outer membrane protein assembly factor BamB
MKSSRSFASGYGLILILMTGIIFHSCKVMQIDTTKTISENQAYNKLQGGVTEIWQNQSVDDEIDEIIQYDDDNIIVSSIKYKHYLSGTLYFYTYSNISILDIANGSLKWTCPTDALEQKQQSIIALKPSIIVNSIADTSTSFTGIDPVNGKNIWKRKFKGQKNSYFSNGKGILYIVYETNPTWNVDCINEKDGEVLWSAPVKDIEPNAFLSFVIPGESLSVVIGNNLIALDQSNGTVKWRKNISQGIFSPFESENKIWCYNQNKI